MCMLEFILTHRIKIRPILYVLNIISQIKMPSANKISNLAPIEMEILLCRCSA